jgi:phosphoribosylformylglycinamidine cyclo-ligase
VPPVFDLVASRGGIDREEMERTFNMGLGFLLVVAPEAVDGIVTRLARAGHDAWPVGSVVAGERGVVLR